ncbi:MAG: hypothetical protein PHE55_10660 [Methylococcaceae bacterium]|nr:hypothetical protein [Methylococcaceae bacterium]
MNSFKSLFALALTVSLAACGDNGSNRSASHSTQARLSGHIINDDGPVTKARIEVKDAKGAIAAHAELTGGTNQYRLDFPAGTTFPLLITVHPSAAPNELLKAAVIDPAAKEQDISPVTTLVVDTALNLGGLSESNLAKAAGAAIAQRGKSGGGSGAATTQSFKGDPTKQYGGWH